MKKGREHSDRLGISQLMLLTAGIGVAFVVARGIEHLRFPADAYYYGAKTVSEVGPYGMLVSGIYGLAVTMLFLAIRSGDFWSSPGKTLALLFATMCILNWGLDCLAAAVVNFRLRTDTSPEVIDRRGHVLGFWYRGFSADVGYVACIPVLLWVVYKSKSQSFTWRLAWVGFLLFALLVVGYTHFRLRDFSDPPLSQWFFEAAIGVPICMLMLSMAIEKVRGRSIDWWTAMMVIPVISVWCIAVVSKALF